MSTTNSKFVIQIQNRQPVGHPVAYDNFLQVTGGPVQETPTNDVIGPYGYEVFEHAPMPLLGVFERDFEYDPTYICREDGVWTNQWKPIPLTAEEIQTRIAVEWDSFRAKRDLYLRITDWTQLYDAPVTEQQRTEWGLYRQQLRDLPTNTTDPFNPVWPTPPSPIQFPKPIINKLK